MTAPTPSSSGPLRESMFTASSPRDPDVRALLESFLSWHEQNSSPGPRLWWRRRPVLFAQLLQRLGVHREVWAPLFFGKRMRVITGEDVSRSLIAFGYSEVALTGLLMHILRSGDSYVDIGTHFGYEAMLAGTIVGSAGEVTCFEPHPATHAMARGNLSGMPQCQVHAKAVGAVPGTIRLRSNSIERSAFNHVLSDGESGESVTVQVTTLDAALAGRTKPVTLIKCDAEGFELPIIEGGAATIAADRPALVLESDMPDERGQNAPRTLALAERMTAFGYDAYNFDFQHALTVAPLGTTIVHHANVLFVHREAASLRAKLNIGR